MPIRKKDEKTSDYVSRCVPEVMKEGRTQTQAVGKCYGLAKWKPKGEKKTKSSHAKG